MGDVEDNDEAKVGWEVGRLSTGQTRQDEGGYKWPGKSDRNAGVEMRLMRGGLSGKKSNARETARSAQGGSSAIILGAPRLFARFLAGTGARWKAPTRGVWRATSRKARLATKSKTIKRTKEIRPEAL